ncbi:LTA synthase family protein [Paenibacillus beijingensis]|uniref:LTA synthase family protein n=1 Tax=Paenibacillus beijingensis TaxID=1126833 RepID=UPI0030833D30
MLSGFSKKTFWFSPFVLFTITMIFKIYLAAFVIYDGELLRPLLTGLPSIWTAFALVELFASRRKLAVYLIVNLLLTTVYFAVIMYYKYFGIIVTYHALMQIGQVAEVKGSVFQLLHPYFLLIYVDIVAAALVLIFNKKIRHSWNKLSNRRFQPLGAPFALFVSMFAICVLIVWPNRGIANELVQNERMGILNYEVFLMATGGNEKLLNPASVNQSAINELKGISEVVNPVGKDAAKGRNVIVVQLEAFQNFLLDKTIDGKEITPNLNKLLKESVYFPHFYQQAGSGNTSDAEFLTNTSLYVPLRVPATEAYADKALPSLPKLFRAQGYEALTFHTNDVAFWNRKNLYQALGFSRYYDRAFFGDEDIVHFGSSDEVLYKKTVAELKKQAEAGKKFYAMIISMSSHHPFNLPEPKNKISLPDRYQDTFVGDYIYSQNYTDYALGVLFDELKAGGLWDNSTIVIYGDHMGLPIYSLSKTDLSLLKELNGRDYNDAQMMNIPLIISAPGALKAQVLTQTGGQSDIMPTIANLAGISLAGTVHFGQDLLNQQHNLLPERYYLPSGSFINDREIFIPGAGFSDGRSIPLTKADKSGNAASTLEADQTRSTRSEFDRALKLLQMSDSYVRSLPAYKPDEGVPEDGSKSR